jgi:hypothetical protein
MLGLVRGLGLVAALDSFFVNVHFLQHHENAETLSCAYI